MSKDKIVGLGILIGSILVLILYTWWVWGSYIQEQIAANPCDGSDPSWWCWASWFKPLCIAGYCAPWELAIILPIWLAIILILIIAGWIGYSMFTTPPPVPLEELEEELEAEEAEAEAEEKSD
ncbi:MAG: hypothetical protein ACTSWN_07710 [Promethearchaeota archaeon]